MTLDEYFTGNGDAKWLFDALREQIDALGPCEVQISKTQISFRRKRAFAWVWIPEKHLGRRLAPLVLSLSLPARDPSPRWKEVVEPHPGRFMHHLELYTPDEMDEEVRAWLSTAYEWAGDGEDLTHQRC